MKDENEYCEIYSLGRRKLMYLKVTGSYSFVERDWNHEKDMWVYREVIVPAADLEEAINIPTSDEMITSGKMKLLFGNYDGMDHFVDFCDDNNIDTMTLFHENA